MDVNLIEALEMCKKQIVILYLNNFLNLTDARVYVGGPSIVTPLSGFRKQMLVETNATLRSLASQVSS